MARMAHLVIKSGAVAWPGRFSEAPLASAYTRCRSRPSRRAASVAVMSHSRSHFAKLVSVFFAMRSGRQMARTESRCYPATESQNERTPAAAKRPGFMLSAAGR